MWSKDTAKYLIDKGSKSEDELTKDLAKYLGYALDTIDYLDDIIDDLRGGEDEK